jgi:hypothetical protein
MLRTIIEAAASLLDDETAVNAPELFPLWQQNMEYKIGDRRRYQTTLYKCILAHTSQADWTPDVAVSLWVRVDDPGEEWPEWVQPVGAQDAYAKGAKVSYEGKHWISNIDNNVWAPTVYGWDQQS